MWLNYVSFTFLWSYHRISVGWCFLHSHRQRWYALHCWCESGIKRHLQRKEKKKVKKNIIFSEWSIKFNQLILHPINIFHCVTMVVFIQKLRRLDLLYNQTRAWGENLLRSRPSMLLLQLLSLNQSTANNDSCFTAER